jgi:hypothetical protein
MYIVGDLNIDQTKYNDLHIIIKKSGMKQLIKDPTRITQTTKSIIDVIITNSLKSDTLTSGVMRCGLSDHDVVYTMRKKHKQLKKNIEVREIRNFKNINTEEVVKMTKEAPWWTMHLSNDINRMFGLYCEIIKIIMNTHIPLKKLRINTRKPIWMTKEYCDSIEAVSRSKIKAVELGTEESWTVYKKLRNKCENYKTNLKFESIKEHINDSINQSKSAWKIFNNEIGKSKCSEVIQMIEVEGEVKETEESVAQSFCDYFANTMESNTKPTAESKMNSEKQPNVIMESSEISHAEILSSIKYLKLNKPTGSDGIPAKFHALFADAISPILHFMFNECLRQGEVPLVLKKTFIKCLYKGKGKKNTCTNYRPI